jgi:hypothetical protein
MNDVVTSPGQAREEMLAAAARHEEELERALVDLKHAVKRPFAIGERLAQHPLPWLIGAVLVGLWLGSRNADRR